MIRTNLTLTALATLLAVGSSAFAAATDTTSAARQIDAILAKDWAKNDLKGNPAADDTTFVRRVYLDVIGRIPTTREAEEFLASKESDKRSKLIDKLLASEGYTQHFYNLWADVLRAQTQGPQTGGITGSAYTNYIKQSLRDNKPYDKFVRDMIAATGKAWDNGAIGYYMRDRGMPLDNMANTVRVFLGTRIECAQCHNHPFDKWSQMQFYQMASYTYGVQTQDYNGGVFGEIRDLQRARVEKEMNEKFPIPVQPKQPKFTKNKKQATQEDRKQFEVAMADYKKAMEKFNIDMKTVNKQRSEYRNQAFASKRGLQEATRQVTDQLRYTTVSFRDRLPQLPHDYKYEDAKPNQKVNPAVMMGHECNTLPGETPLEAYARWMTSKDNPRFTSVVANRLWKKAFGLALIEPLDELLDATTPMIPELQTHLEKLMKDLNYDMKAYLRVLLNTSTYQRQVTKQEVAAGTVYHFTGPVLRRMTPEQMWDSFVTLINPNPDMINVDQRANMEQRVLQAKKTADSVEVLGAEKLLEGFEAAAKLYDKGMAGTGDITKQSSELRRESKELEKKAEKATGKEKEELLAKAGELKAKMKEVNRVINEMTNVARKAVTDNVMVPGQKKLYEKVTGKPFEMAALKTTEGGEKNYGGGDMMMMSSSGKSVRVMIPGYDKEQKTKEQAQADSEAAKKVWAEEAEFYGIPQKQWKDYFANRGRQSRDWLRSAEIDSPAPRGHYLREFGQSDRETIENANNEASVPQALAMMNGQLLPQIIGNFSQLMLTVSKAQYPDDKIEAAYMSILSRKPTAKEKELWLQAQDKGLSSMEDLIFALLNTQQFIFIQ